MNIDIRTDGTMDKQNDKTNIAKLRVAYSNFRNALKKFSCSVLYMHNQSPVLAITRLNDIPLTFFCVKRLKGFPHQNSTNVSCNTILYGFTLSLATKTLRESRYIRLLYF